MERLLAATARAERDHFWFRGFRRFVTPLIVEAAGCAQPVAILDCGCGTGHNLKLLRRYGRPVGIDLTWAGLQFAKEQGERSVARASATQLPFAEGTFDLVTSFDVIYALEEADERTAIREMYRVLRPGGHVIVNVAAGESLRGNHSVLGGEVRRYSRGMLWERLEAGGFEVLRMTYTNASIFPLVAGVRWAQRLSGHKASDLEISVPPAPVNALLSGVLAVESAALRMINMPIGSSLLALARRPAA